MVAAKAERPSVLARRGQGQGAGEEGWLATFGTWTKLTGWCRVGWVQRAGHSGASGPEKASTLTGASAAPALKPVAGSAPATAWA